MASGKEHSAASIGLAAGVSLGYLSAYILDPIQAPIVSLGAFFSVLVSNDMDVDEGNISYLYMRNIGKIFESIWSVFWRSYAISMKHRGISHWPIIGTIHRLIFIVFPFIILLLPVSDQDSGFSEVFYYSCLSTIIASPLTLILWYVFHNIDLNLFLYYFLPFVAGLVLGDLLHIIFDYI